MLGDTLRYYRKKVGLTQEQLAEKAGIHRTYVSLLERNLKSPTIDTLFLICNALHVKPSSLIKALETEQEKK